VVQIYRGLPPEDPPVEPSRVKSVAWIEWRFLLAFFVIVICFIVIILAVFCLRRRSREVFTAVDELVS